MLIVFQEGTGHGNGQITHQHPLQLRLYLITLIQDWQQT